MIDFEYARYIAELLADENITESMFYLRFETIRKLRGMISGYEKDGFIKELVEAVFCKKAEFIMKAETKLAIEAIIKPCIPQYYGGEFLSERKYHVEEEELFLWSYASLKGLLIPAGQKRFEMLFEKYCGKLMEDLAA